MSQDNQIRNKRKRKKSFLKNARKYAKKGCYGRGSQLDSDTYNYFVRIMEAYREGFENEEDKLVFVNNVFQQTESREVNCSCNQVGCRVIETLLPFANDSVLKRFMEAFGADLRPLCSDRFASHVLEALVRVTCSKSLQTSDETLKSEYKTFAFKISKFLLNNLEDFVWDTYGNHIIRTCLENLSGIPKENAKNEDAIEVPEDYSEVVIDYGQRLLKWPQFGELCASEKTSGLLQVLLKALAKLDRKLLKQYLKKLLDEVFAPSAKDAEPTPKEVFPPAFMSQSVAMLLETCLQVAKGKNFTQIYAKCFAGRLALLAKTRSTNFSVQKLLSNCDEKTEFEAMFDELSDSFKTVIGAGHTGVILALAQGCKRLSAKQGSFVQNLMKSLDCYEPEERQNAFALCMCRFKPFDEIGSTTNLSKEKLSLHGTLILQLILEFNKPIKAVNSLLSMEVEDLKNIFSNSMGSHIVDSYVTSVYVGEKSREKLVRKMKNTYQELASSKYGSRSFEAIWNVANLKSRISIMEELSYKDALWSNLEHGKIIAGKVNLPLFKRNKEEWKSSLNKTGDKAKKMLENLLK